MTNLEHALRYAAMGWHAFPCYEMTPAGCACGRPERCRPATSDSPKIGSPGKHPRTKNGLKDATTDAAQITAWWTRWPNANIAVQTGQESGFWALDIDPKHDGDEGLYDLEKQHGELPPTLMAITGGGGNHYLWAWQDGAEIKSVAGGVAPGIDTRGHGGYIILPPSNHESGRRYEWDAAAPETTSPAPPWLLAVAPKRGERKAQTQALVPQPNELLDLAANLTGNAEIAGVMRRGVPLGARNDAATRVIGSLIGQGHRREVVESLAQDWARRCVPPIESPPVITDMVDRLWASHHDRQAPVMPVLPPPIDAKGEPIPDPDAEPRQGAQDRSGGSRIPLPDDIRAARLAAVAAVIGISIADVVMVKADQPSITIVLSGGESITMAVQQLLSFAAFRASVFGATGTLIRRMKGDAWDQIVQALGDVARTAETGPEGTEAGETVLWLEQFFACTAGSTSDSGGISHLSSKASVGKKAMVFAMNDRLFFSLSGLVHFLYGSFGMIISTKIMAPRLKRIAAEREGRFGNPKRRWWSVPIGDFEDIAATIGPPQVESPSAVRQLESKSLYGEK